MDYSLLVGIHNVDQACQKQANEEAVAGSVDQRRPQGQKSLYSTAIEAIQAEASSMGSMESVDKCVTMCLWPLRDHMRGNFLVQVSHPNYMLSPMEKH